VAVDYDRHGHPHLGSVVTVEEWALVCSVVFTGLWSGLLLMLTTVLHPMMQRMDGAGFARFLAAFLPVARKAASNYIAIIGMVVASLAAVVTLADTPGEAPFVLAAIGFLLCLGGPLLISSRLAEPNYDVILGWDPDALPAGWQAVQQRYYALNWIRAAVTWVAFGVFLAALVILVGGE
jgi:hypothetical protein